MFVKSVKFENFRNLADGVFYPDKGVNVIYGDNAQGKTNLAEAIWLFTGQKSFRGTRDFQLVNKQNTDKNAVLSAEFFSAGRNQSAQIKIANKRSVVLNESAVSSPTKLSDGFSAVVFSPADMQLIDDGPAIRRRFFDNAISILRPKYGKIITAYNRAVQQRNVLLKDVQYHSELSFMLDAFEDHIAKYGEYIISQRKKYLAAITENLPEIYGGLSDNREQIAITYKASGFDNEDDLTADKLREAIMNNRKEDIKTAVTSIGPHRDDFDIFINGDSVKVYGSQGQKRSSIIALKLCEAEILKRLRGERPIMILDDVMSELDRSRQNYILNHIKDWQVFITCCDPETVENLKSGSCFHIQNGAISAE